LFLCIGRRSAMLVPSPEQRRLVRLGQRFQMHTSHRDAVFASRAVAWREPAGPGAARARSRLAEIWTAFIRLLCQWRKRQKLRRELSLMSPRDFGDLAVPPSLVRDELRRWPWQDQSREWGQLAPRRRRADGN
jgi:uncharacterized protein YjiS (DUF1127 family)